MIHRVPKLKCPKDKFHTLSPNTVCFGVNCPLDCPPMCEEWVQFVLNKDCWSSSTPQIVHIALETLVSFRDLTI